MTMRRICSLLPLVVAMVFLGATGAGALDAPHDTIQCDECHGLHGAAYPALLGNLCESCHFEGGPALAVQTHSSRTLDAGYGNWEVDCWACHDPHTQEQNDAYGTSYGMLLRVILNAEIKEIDPAGPGPYYPAISILGTVTSSDIRHTSTTGFVDGDASSTDDVCQVCHEQTLYYEPLNAFNYHLDYGVDSQPGGDCVQCHPHGSGFRPQGCVDCHSEAQGSPTLYRRQITASGGVGSANYNVRDEFNYTPAAGGTDTVRDEFTSASFSNDDGTASWSASWVEDDPESGGSGTGSGAVQITGGELRLDDRPNTGGKPSAAREVDLSGGATSATFSFDFRTGSGVDTGDRILVQASDNGGGSYTTIETMNGISGTSSGSRSYDLLSYVSATANTRIRFIVDRGYGGSNEFFYVDNVQIEYGTPPGGCDTSVWYTGNDGTVSFAGTWQEMAAESGNDPCSGDIQVVVTASNGELRLRNAVRSVYRQVNLSSATAAQLNFDFRTEGVDSADAIVIEASSDGGGSYTPIDTITGISGATSSSRSYNLLSFVSAAADTRVRFRVSSGYTGAAEFFYADNIEVLYAAPVAGGGGDFVRTSHHVSDGSTTEIVTNADCSVCHDQLNHQFIVDANVLLNDPDGGTSYAYDGGGASIENFCVNCHDADSSTAFDSNAFAGDGNQPFTDGRTPPDIATDWTSAAHNAASPAPLGDEACMACHGGPDSTRSGLSADPNAHGSDQVKLLSELVNGFLVSNVEEQLCYACHDGGTASDVETQITKAVNHPMDAAGQAALPTAGRTVECIDCHNPHAATGPAHNYSSTATSSRNQVSQALIGVPGVEPSWPAGNFASISTYTELEAVKEYQICFKCHTSYDWGAGSPPYGISSNGVVANPIETDVAQEFNPANASFHPVVVGLDDASSGSSSLQNAQMAAPWDSNLGTQTMMCSDCHNTDASTPAAQGPHGSAVAFMLRGPNTLWPPTDLIEKNMLIDEVYNTSFCSNCHTYTANNRAHDKHDDRDVYCYSCHIVVPHGGKLARLMGDRDSMPSRYAYNNDLNTMEVQGFRKQTDYANYDKPDCAAACEISNKHPIDGVQSNW